MSRADYLIRNTARQKGHFISITPENSPLRYLSCGRLILDQTINQILLNSGEQEVSLICLKGQGTVKMNGQDFTMRPYDAIYAPGGTALEVATDTSVDFAEALAPGDRKGEPIFVSFESVKNNPKLHLLSGGETYSREIYKLIDTNIPAARLLCGITFGKPGNWTSWAPHEHGKSKEEVYLFIEMPRPAFGLQLMYDDEGGIDFVERVFEDDAVIIPNGYHPNVGIPGYGINFVWMMAAFNPETDRDWTDMNFQKEFIGKY